MAASHSPALPDVEELVSYLNESTIRLAVFGEFSAGKTTVLNALIGEEILSVAVDPTTAVPTWIVAEADQIADLFVEDLEEPGEPIVLDLDATHDPLHGDQEGKFFHGYYDCYCYLPFYIFCGEELLCAKLRRSDGHVRQHRSVEGGAPGG